MADRAIDYAAASAGVLAAALAARQISAVELFQQVAAAIETKQPGPPSPTCA